MAHTALYGGTVYEKKGGADLVGGTVYKKDHGKVLVGGTAYEVGFGVPCTVTIIAFGMSPNGSANVTLDGQTYSAKGVAINPNNYTTIAELTVPSGTVMSCSACTSVGNARGTIVLNGTNVAEAASAGVPVSYDYVVNGNIQVELNEAHVVVSNLSVSRVLITEIPEGHALVKITSSGTGIDPKYGYVLIDGVTYNTSSTLVIPVGTVITCFVSSVGSSYDPDWSISLNGTIIKEPDKMFPEIDCTYKYTVIGNVGIALLYNKGNCEMYITEQ